MVQNRLLHMCRNAASRVVHVHVVRLIDIGIYANRSAFFHRFDAVVKQIV